MGRFVRPRTQGNSLQVGAGGIMIPNCKASLSWVTARFEWFHSENESVFPALGGADSSCFDSSPVPGLSASTWLEPPWSSPI